MTRLFPARFVKAVFPAIGLVLSLSCYAQDEKDIPLAKSISKLNALLVMEVEGGEMAGTACDLIMTAVDGEPSLMRDLEFNQPVGRMMERGMEAAQTAVRVRHPGAGKGKQIRISFADQFTPKDGASASLAVAMLYESLIVGTEFRPDCAVTGDLTSDAKVRPIGGLESKVRAAGKAGCSCMCFPLANAQEIDDMIVDGRLADLFALQVVAVETLDEALGVAATKRPEEIASAMDKVEKLLEMARGKGGVVLSSPESKARIAEILAVMPNNITARTMNMYANRALPQRYTLIGSMVRLNKAVVELNESFAEVESGSEAALRQLLTDDGLNNVYTRVRTNVLSIKGKLHPDVNRYQGAISRYLQLLSKLPHNAKTKQRASFMRYLEECRDAAKLVETEEAVLMKRPEVRDAMIE